MVMSMILLRAGKLFRFYQGKYVNQGMPHLYRLLYLSMVVETRPCCIETSDWKLKLPHMRPRLGNKR